MNFEKTLIALTIVGLLSGCGVSVNMQLPEHFVALAEEDRGSDYHMRATTPDGVVIAARRLDHRVEGTLTFWTEALERRFVDEEGYALRETEDVTAASGQAGKLLHFARDLDGHEYRYSVAVFVTKDHIWLVEAGGREALYTPLEEEIESAIASLSF